MKKVLILSRNGTCYLDYRIISQAVFLKNSGFDVIVIEANKIYSERNKLYEEKGIPVIEAYQIAPKIEGLLKLLGLGKIMQKHFTEIRPKIKREALRLLGLRKIIVSIERKSTNNITLQKLNIIKPNFIITRDLLDSGVIAYKAKNPEVKIIADLHEVLFFQHGYLDKKLQNLQDKELKHASYIINVTPQIAETYYKHFLDEGRTIIIPNAPSLALTPSKKPGFIQNKQIKFLCHGFYKKNRDIKLINFIKDFVQYSPNHFVLYLRFDNKNIAMEALKVYYQNTKAKERIFFLNPVQGIYNEIESMIDNYDIGISFLHTELGGQYTMSSPNRFGTYTHAGLAILTNESLFMGEIVKEKNLGFIVKENNFKEVIEFIANNPEKVLECKQNAYKFAKESFNYEFFGKEIVKLLK